jgi:hypothetical protein
MEISFGKRGGPTLQKTKMTMAYYLHLSSSETKNWNAHFEDRM